MNQQRRQSTESNPSRIASVLEEYLTQAENNGVPDRQEFLALHPDIAEQLAPCLESLDLLHHATLGFDNPTAGDAFERSRLLGDFRLLAEIGRGGMGIVYEAEQVSLNRRVAVKVLPLAALLSKSQLARFKNEGIKGVRTLCLASG